MSRRRHRRLPTRAIVVIGLAVALASACALRLGRPGPETYRIVLASPPSAPVPAAMGEWLRALDAQVAFVAATADSAWFAATAAAADLTASGPARADSVDGSRTAAHGPALGFLAWEPVGDTTLRIGTAESGRILVHDALYRTGRGKPLDLMIVSVPAGADPREVTRVLLTYVATDVMHDAIVVLALRAPDGAAADTIGALLRPVFSGAAQCEDRLEPEAAARPGALRLYYSPVVRVRCEAVRGFREPFPALLARLVLGG